MKGIHVGLNSPEAIRNYIIATTFPNYSLKKVSDRYQKLDKTETDIHRFSLDQAKLLYLAFQIQHEAMMLLNKCTMMHPYTPVGADKTLYDEMQECSRVVFRMFWKDVKDQLVPRLPWVKPIFKTLEIRNGNMIAINHLWIPDNVRKNEALSLVPQLPTW